MSDYEAFEMDAESDLEVYGAEQEVSGFDSFTTTQEGLMIDEFRKNAEMTIDTIGEAQKAKEHREKEEKTADQAKDVFMHQEAARRAAKGDEKLKIGKYELSRDEWKEVWGGHTKRLKEKLKNAKSPEDAAAIMARLQMAEEIQQALKDGKELTEEQKRFVAEEAERDPDLKFELEQFTAGMNKVTFNEEVTDRIADATGEYKVLSSVELEVIEKNITYDPSMKGVSDMVVVESVDVDTAIQEKMALFEEDPSLTVGNQFNAMADDLDIQMQQFNMGNVLVAQNNHNVSSENQGKTYASTASMDMSDFSL